MQKVSVIIPVYRVEKYISECLDSVINQTYQNLEIIIIDDGSPENEHKIIEKYAKSDKRIKFIRQKNMGLSGARNTGMKHATGEWLYFIDSDDHISKTFISDLVNAATKNNVDIAINDNIVPFLGHIPKSGPELKHKPGVYEMTPDKIYHVFGVVNAWNKLYKRSTIKKLKLEFPVGKKFEDTWFYYILMPQIKNVALTHGGTYFYRQTPTSIIRTTKQRKSNNWDMINLFVMIWNEYKKHGWDKKILPPIRMLRSSTKFCYDSWECFNRIKLALNRIKIDLKKLDKKDAAFIQMINKNQYMKFKFRFFFIPNILKWFK